MRKRIDSGLWCFASGGLAILAIAFNATAQSPAQAGPTVSEVVFKHAKHGDARDLQAIVAVKPGMPMNHASNKKACADIAAYYKARGYFFANVTMLKDDKPGKVIFNITEGPRVRVRDIKVVAGDKATAAHLQAEIGKRMAFSGFSSGVFQVVPTVESNVDLINERYRTRGFLDVAVSQERKFTDDYQYVDFTYWVQEGIRYRIADWTVSGAKEFPAEQLAAVVTIQKGAYYDETAIDTDMRNLTDYGGFRGFNLKVKKNVTKSKGAPGLVHVEYQVEGGAPAKIGGDIIIIGGIGR